MFKSAGGISGSSIDTYTAEEDPFYRHRCNGAEEGDFKFSTLNVKNIPITHVSPSDNNTCTPRAIPRGFRLFLSETVSTNEIILFVALRTLPASTKINRLFPFPQRSYSHGSPRCMFLSNKMHKYYALTNIFSSIETCGWNAGTTQYL